MRSSDVLFEVLRRAGDAILMYWLATYKARNAIVFVLHATHYGRLHLSNTRRITNVRLFEMKIVDRKL